MLPVSCRVPCHIVHLSSGSAVASLRKARQAGVPISVETTYHYLTLTAEEIPDGATQFKCCPPIRDITNQVRYSASYGKCSKGCFSDSSSSHKSTYFLVY